jgi:hypothetical protein
MWVDRAADLDAADREALGLQLDLVIRVLRHVTARVIAGAAGTILYVAVLPKGCRRDARLVFAAS